MEEGESVIEALCDDDNDDCGFEDVDMADVEEGELVENASTMNELGGGGGRGGENVASGNEGEDGRRRGNKKNRRKKNKRKRGGAAPNVTDINRFVLDTCRRLKEKKSYMVYTAVGCLGVSALSNLMKEVDAIQSCGGQMTVDGKRFRTGGGILWNIMKSREPMAYKEIMKKTKEFEKQFKQQNKKQAPEQKEEASPEKIPHTLADDTSASAAVMSQPLHQNENEHSGTEGKRKSIHERIRVPVSYDDLVGDDPKEDSV